MKKLSLLVFHKEYEQFLADLQKVGVMHIEEQKQESETASQELAEAHNQQERLNASFKVLDDALAATASASV
ncbi:MAG: V-type ATP synthase subunit I, partial [Bacteroidaceae bacterium]|nr:V-type ATP synthase subunit I [Bacteroidaceae bacterium]